MWFRPKPGERREVWPTYIKPVARVFPPHVELALYDRNKDRITVWFPGVDGYVCEDNVDGEIAHYVGIRMGGREYDHFEFRECRVPLRTGFKCSFEPPEHWKPSEELK